MPHPPLGSFTYTNSTIIEDSTKTTLNLLMVSLYIPAFFTGTHMSSRRTPLQFASINTKGILYEQESQFSPLSSNRYILSYSYIFHMGDTGDVTGISVRMYACWCKYER